jgi:hypothetical protein
MRIQLCRFLNMQILYRREKIQAPYDSDAAGNRTARGVPVDTNRCQGCV